MTADHMRDPDFGIPMMVSNLGIQSRYQILLSNLGIKFCSSWGMFWGSDIGRLFSGTIENVLPILSFKT